eukprot:5441485-Pyramimonas_sp.AAC.1
MTRQATIDEWAGHIRARRVWATGGGPPCESWCPARWLEGGAPPLRTAEYFWGVPWASPTQAQQLEV